MLELSDIAKRFGPTVALDGVNLELRPGEVKDLRDDLVETRDLLVDVRHRGLQLCRGDCPLSQITERHLEDHQRIANFVCH